MLLTPLYLRLARRAGVDPVAVALVPLLLASLASSVLPVSNLTTFIAAQQFHLGVGPGGRPPGPAQPGRLDGRLAGLPAPPPDHPGLPARSRRLTGGRCASAARWWPACWSASPWAARWAYRPGRWRWWPTPVLVVVTRWLPWRTVPVATAAGVAAVAAAVALVVPSGWLAGLLEPRPAAGAGRHRGSGRGGGQPGQQPARAAGGAGRRPPDEWGMWAWLLGVNTAAVLLPLGALANLLWRRVLADDDVAVSWRRPRPARRSRWRSRPWWPPPPCWPLERALAG